MKKDDIIYEIEKLKSELFKENEKPLVDNVRTYNNGGIYWLNELMIRIEKMKRSNRNDG